MSRTFIRVSNAQLNLNSAKREWKISFSNFTKKWNNEQATSEFKQNEDNKMLKSANECIGTTYH